MQYVIFVPQTWVPWSQETYRLLEIITRVAFCYVTTVIALSRILPGIIDVQENLTSVLWEHLLSLVENCIPGLVIRL